MVAVATPPKKQKAKPVNGSPNPVASQQPAQIVPMLGETQGQFFDRAFRALKASVQQVNQRTVEVIRLWKQSQNSKELNDAAMQRFAADKFTHFGPRCVFLQHVVPDSPEVKHPQTGATVRRAIKGTNYDRNALQKMVDFANYRILNAGQFAAISDGHLPTADEKASGRPDPDTLGYAGPFYLGCFGNLDPQWAIYCDEWVHNEDLDRFQKLQRRSPEVWQKEPIERRTMDPIAALGSETPRLDSGMNLYCLRAADGQEVMRYSMSLALPGPENTFVPGSESGRKAKYGANQMPPMPNQMDAAQQPSNPGADQAQQIAQAVAQVVAQLMPTIAQGVQDVLSQGNPADGDAVPTDGGDPMGDTDNGGGDDPNIPRGMDAPDDSANAGGDAPPAGPASGADPSNPNPSPSPAAPSAAPPSSPMASVPAAAPTAPPSPSPAGQPASQPATPPAAIDEDHKKYAAMSPDCGAAYAAGHSKGRQAMTTAPAKYSKANDGDDGLASVVASQAEQIKTLQQQMADQAAAIQQERTDAARYSRLMELSREYAFDPKEEMETVIDMTDDQFERHTSKTVAKYSKRGDVENVELFDDPSVAVDDVAQYSRRGAASKVTAEQVKRCQRKAEDICTKKIQKGEKPDFETEFAAVCKADGIPV